MVGIVGLGLIGGSLARALPDVVAWDSSEATRHAAEGAGIEIVSPKEMASLVEVVFLAVPPSEVLHLAEIVLENGEAVLSDTASIKNDIWEGIKKRFPGAPYLGGHPLAGRASSGWEASSHDLLVGAPWALVGEEIGEEILLPVARSLLPLGGSWAAVYPAEHDRLLARTSHLVQMIHLALAAQMCEWSPLALRLSGPALRDTTRLARSDLGMWKDILGGNKENVSGALFSFQEELRQAQLLLEDESGMNMLWRHALMGREALEDVRWSKESWRETSIPLYCPWQELCRRSADGSLFRNPRLHEGLLVLEESR